MTFHKDGQPSCLHRALDKAKRRLSNITGNTSQALGGEEKDRIWTGPSLSNHVVLFHLWGRGEEVSGARSIRGDGNIPDICIYIGGLYANGVHRNEPGKAEDRYQQAVARATGYKREVFAKESSRH